MSEPLIVVGAGGHGKVVVATLLAAGRPVAAVLDDDPRHWGSDLLGVRVSGPTSGCRDLGTHHAVLAVGDNRARQALAASLGQVPGLTWATAVHPAAVVHPSARLGPGTVVFAGSVVQPDAVLGAHAIVNTSASVDHDCRIGAFVHVAPGCRLAGDVEVGEGTLLGIGCRVLPGGRVGSWAVVGAGATVIRPVGDGWTVFGTPARQISRRSR